MRSHCGTVRHVGGGCQFARKWRETFPRDQVEEDILKDGENIKEQVDEHNDGRDCWLKPSGMRDEMRAAVTLHPNLKIKLVRRKTLDFIVFRCNLVVHRHFLTDHVGFLLFLQVVWLLFNCWLSPLHPMHACNMGLLRLRSSFFLDLVSICRSSNTRRSLTVSAMIFQAATVTTISVNAIWFAMLCLAS